MLSLVCNVPAYAFAIAADWIKASWFSLENASLSYPEALGRLVTDMMHRGFTKPTNTEPILRQDGRWSAQAYNFVDATAYADINTLAGVCVASSLININIADIA